MFDDDDNKEERRIRINTKHVLLSLEREREHVRLGTQIEACIGSSKCHVKFFSLYCLNIIETDCCFLKQYRPQ
jgi:hypothetical protein